MTCRRWTKAPGYQPEPCPLANEDARSKEGRINLLPGREALPYAPYKPREEPKKQLSNTIACYGRVDLACIDLCRDRDYAESCFARVVVSEIGFIRCFAQREGR